MNLKCSCAHRTAVGCQAKRKDAQNTAPLINNTNSALADSSNGHGTDGNAEAAILLVSTQIARRCSPMATFSRLTPRNC